MLTRFLFCGFVLIITACRAESIPSKIEPKIDSVHVEVTKARPTKTEKMIFGTGKIEREREIDLSFHLPGLLTSLHMDVGDIVEDGALIATIEDIQLNTKLNEAKASHKLAKQKLKRDQKLSEGNWISAQRLENSITRTELAKFELESAQNNKSKTRLFSPSNGTIVARHVQAGEYVLAGRPVVTLSDHSSKVFARISIPEIERSQITLNSSARVELSSNPGQFTTGTVKKIEPEINPTTGTVDVLISLPEKTHWNLGATVTTSILTKSTINEQQETVEIPAESIVSINGTVAQVFIVDNKTQTAQLEEVEFIRFNNDYAEIIGISTGTITVTFGGSQIRNGTKLVYDAKGL